MTNLEIITEYRKLKKIGILCKELGIDQSNLIYGRTTKENEEIIANVIKDEIRRIYCEIILNRGA